MDENVFAPPRAELEVAPKPSAIPVSAHMGAWEIFGTGMRWFFRNLSLVVPIGLLTQLPATLAGVGVGSLDLGQTQVFVNLAVNLLTAIGLALAVPSALYGVLERETGRAPTIGESLAFGLSRWGTTFFARLFAGMITGVATLCLILPGVYFALLYALTDQVVLMEPNARSALDRSSTLVRGQLLPMLLTAILPWGMTVIIGAALGALAGLTQFPAMITLATFLVAPFSLLPPVVLLVFYLSLRMERAALDLDDPVALPWRY